MSAITFLLFLAALGLRLWRPQASAAGALRVFIWTLMSFVCGLSLLASAFSVWWPPTQWWSLVWSAATAVVLVLIAISNTRPEDWQH